jgi:hypothetical protein
MASITWYSITQDLTIDERGPLELSEALRVVDGYSSRLRPHYDSGEVALAETMFGFSRASDDFIEICLHTLREISLDVELPPSPADGAFAGLDGSFQGTLALDSLDSLRRHVTAYFTLTPDEFRTHLQPLGD